MPAPAPSADTRRPIVLWVLLFSLPLWLSAVSPVSAQDGLLRNPSFEQAEGDLPAGWSPFIHGQGFTLSRDDALGHTGQASGRLDGEPGAADRSCFLQASASFAPPRAVRLRFWYRGTGESTGILRFRPIPGVEVESGEYGTLHFSNELPQPDWRERVVEAVVPAQAREADQVRAEIILYQRGTGTVWYDDVVLELLEEWQPMWRGPETLLECPWRPADGRTVLQTPPDFSWTPQAGAQSYSWQLSRSPEFPPDATETAEHLPYNCYSHHHALERGEWFWRVKFRQDQGGESAWSQVRRFVVPDDAVPFPVPSPEELLARVPQSHPRVIATQATLAAFRDRRTGPAAEWWEGFRSQCDGYLEAEIDREPAADLKLGDRDGALTDEIVADGRKLRSAASRATARLHALAFAYLVSGDVRYAEGATARMLEMATWDPDGVTSYRNHDQVFRDITWKMAVAYDWCCEAMTDEQRRRVLQAIDARARVLYADFAGDSRPISARPYDSHGWTALGFLGIVAVATCHDHPPADDWFRFVASVYPPLLPPWGGEEGGWSQGVGYWKWSTNFGFWYFDALKSATGLDLYQKAWSRNNGWYKLYMHPPFCDRHHFGDGNHGPPGGTDRLNMARWAAVHRDPYFQWYADTLGGHSDSSYHGYFWYDDELEPRPPADIPQARYFADIGWVGMHSALYDPDDIMLLFKSSPYGSYNHSHADQNHFVVYAYGEPLLIDSGYYDWYGSPHDAGWTRQTKAHNCVLVNGEGQPIFRVDAQGRIIAFRTSPLYDYAAGDATAAYMGKLTRFVRHVIFLRPDTFVIVDDLAAPEASEFTWCLHAEEQMQLDPAEGTVDVSRGRAKLRVRFVEPDQLSVRQDDDFGVDPSGERPREWHAYVTPEGKQTDRRSVTLLIPRRSEQSWDEPEASLQSTAQALSLSLAWPDGRAALVALDAGDDGRLALAEVRQDGLPQGDAGNAGRFTIAAPGAGRTPIGEMTTWDGQQLYWGPLALPAGPYRVAIEGTGRVSIGRSAGTGPDPVWIDERAACMAVVPPGEELHCELTPLITDPEPLLAREVSEAVVARSGALRFEAETYADVTGGTASAYSHRTFLSGGQGVETQIVGGIRLTWQVDVPVAARYSLLIRGATHEPYADRLIEIDGLPLGGEHRVHRFACTGGFGAEPAEWQSLSPCGEGGKPLVADLSAGAHELSLALVQNRLNLDYLAFVPVGQ